MKQNKELKEKYLALYNEAKKRISLLNFCGWKNNKCSRGYSCCTGCKFLTKKGCRTKNLACALWKCKEVKLPPKEEEEWKNFVEKVFMICNENHIPLYARASLRDLFENYNKFKTETKYTPCFFNTEEKNIVFFLKQPGSRQ